MPTTSNNTVLLLGGTGKISSRIAPLLSSSDHSVLVASRSGNFPSLPHCQGVKFDWFDSTTYTRPFGNEAISAAFLVAPPIMDCFPPMKTFIDLAMQKGVKRFVLLSASLLDVGDGPMMGKVSKYVTSLNVEYAILRPTWFMENFSEVQHLATIQAQDTIITATGEGKVPFVSANDIAAVAYRALTDKIPHNTDHLILGSMLFSYDDVAAILTSKLGRKITHVKITEDEAAAGMIAWGIPEDYAKVLAQLDTAIKEGQEERVNDVVMNVTGKAPVSLEAFISECLAKGVWDRK